MGLDCRKCSDTAKDVRGCEKDVAPYIIYTEEVTRCPLKLITPRTQMYLSIYNAMKNTNRLYNLGEIAHQPAKLMEIFSVIENEMNRKQINDMKDKHGS